jgi:hypothetical protein
MTTDIFEDITKYYSKLTYFSKYFKDIIFTLLILSIVSLIVIYFYIKIRINTIRKEWPINRCNPIYIPFAGLIKKNDGKSILESTQINFIDCQNNILNSITSKFFNPLDHILAVITSVYTIMLTTINYIRNIVGYIKKRIIEILSPIIVKIIEMLNPLIIILIYIRDAFSKMVGILKTVISVTITFVYTFISFILNFYKIVRAMMLIGMAATLALQILSMIPFIGIIAIPLTIISAITTLVLVVFTIILSILSNKLFKKVNKTNITKPMPGMEKDVAEMKARQERVKQRKEAREKRIRERRERREQRIRERRERREKWLSSRR